jgi:hypothetical protein
MLLCNSGGGRGKSSETVTQVQLYTSGWKLVTCKHSKLETTYNTLVDFVAQTRAMCKELPPEAISTCQSDLSLMLQSVSRIHRSRRIISEITKDKEEEVFNFDNMYTFHFVHPAVFQYTHYIISVTTQQFMRRLHYPHFMRYVSAVQPSSGKHPVKTRQYFWRRGINYFFIISTRYTLCASHIILYLDLHYVLHLDYGMNTNNTLHLQKSCYIVVNTAEDFSPFHTNSMTYFISNNLKYC